MDAHFTKRAGERTAQLANRDHHGERLLVENVLLPALGTFDHLHPEYEYVLSDQRTVFLDVAYIKTPLHINFELDGFSTHASKITRDQFAIERRRDILLQLEGWHVFRFAYDDVRDRPHQAIQLVRRFMDKFTSAPPTLPLAQRELIRLALSRPGQVITMKEIRQYTGYSDKTAHTLMVQLVKQSVFQCVSPQLQRIHAYKLNPYHQNVQGWINRR
jgi:hypothetical protein